MRNFHSKNVRYLSCLVLIVFILGTLVSLVPSFAATSPFDEDAFLLSDEERLSLYLTEDNLFTTREAKFATMTPRLTLGDYQIRVDENTGEVGVQNIKTGQILLTNPHDVASAPEANQKKLMNQIVLNYQNVKNNNGATLESFANSAMYRQITVKNIRNGIRVEYTLGRETSKQLLPFWIEATRFESLLAEPGKLACWTQEQHDAWKVDNPSSSATMESKRENIFKTQFYEFYTLIDLNGKDDKTFATQKKQYPCAGDEDKKRDYDGDGQLEFMKIYALNETVEGKPISEGMKNSIETFIKQFTSYSYEDLQYDIQETEYAGKESNPALFRLALEYTLNENGFEVRLPANSIRYDEDSYRLTSIDVLPYFGTTSNDFTGYTFIPDGSGAIIRNEDTVNLGRNTYTIRGQIYGPDFAYHTLSSQYFTGRDKVMRLPVFGTVEDTVTVTPNYDKKVGYIWETVEDLTDKGEKQFYTDADPIMLDAVDKDGKLITTLEAYFAQFKANDAGDVIRIGDPLWDSPDYTKTIEVSDGEDPLEHYNKYVEAGEVPMIVPVTFSLMAPVLDEEGEQLTYKGLPVYTFVDEEGNPVDEANRVEGIIKIKEQLWYNGKPAFYNTDVPVDPSAVTPGGATTPETPEDGEEGEAPEGGEEGEAPEGGEGESTPTDPETPETPGEGEGEGEGEEEIEIEYYNDVVKTKEVYDTIAYEEIESEVSQGYVAVVTEGASLCVIISNHGCLGETNPGGIHKYNSVYLSVTPRPFDKYRLADAISVSSDSAEWTVVSDRKYIGSYRIQYTMLTDATYIENNQTKEYKYEASYVGMSAAYRDLLIRDGALAELTDLDDDLPLYLEAFGKTTATKVVATIPMVMDVPLTTFEDLKTIYKQLDGDGIDNVNFRLTGFTKGGLYSYAPSALKFESVVGGNGDYEDMVTYCKEISAQKDKNLSIFPEFDFANVKHVGSGDGFDSLDDAARTIDDRYASKREYDITYQSLQPVGSITVSPSVYQKLYDTFAKKIDKLGVDGLSFASLGTDLNSDFDSDDAYNREDSRYYTVELLKQAHEKYGKIMIDGGNSYALPYADYILNLALESSGRGMASYTVPFMGMVFHGYINYAGTATGMASDLDREILRMIENGAAPFFTIAFQNTSSLKDDFSYSDYYSIDYAICYEQIVETYNTMNTLIGDLQDATITDHQFLEGIRLLGAKEQAHAEELKAYATDHYDEILAAAKKKFADKEYLIDKVEKPFDEAKFLEENPQFTSLETYVQFVEDEYAASLDRVVSAGDLVLVEYTRKDGTTKSFVLNYGPYDATVVVGGTEYIVASNGYAVVGQ